MKRLALVPEKQQEQPPSRIRVTFAPVPGMSAAQARQASNEWLRNLITKAFAYQQKMELERQEQENGSGKEAA